MQRKLIALAVAGLVTAPAFAQAQSNVTIYGQLDAQYIHWTRDNTAGTFQSPMGNGIGFMGEEDLGSGLKAFFKLEERFNIDDGSRKDLRWNEISFVGLKGKFGEAILGRIPTALDTIYPDPGSGDTVGSGLDRKAFAAGRAVNAVRYTSPALGPVSIIAHYGLSEATPTSQPYGPVNVYGIAATAKFGMAQIDAGWQRDADLYKRWAIYGGYDFGVVTLGLGHARAKNFSDAGQNAKLPNGDLLSQTTYGSLLTCSDVTCKVNSTYFGGYVPVATGKIGFTVSRIGGKVDDVKIKARTRYGVSYWHDLSKRTQLVASVAYEHQKVETYNDGIADVGSTGFDGHDSRYGAQVGIRHKF